ncbi:MAG TPA: DUF2721 domain-containing protein [Anaerolineae bacterium]|nr:DUF2721 domain-containing protein [Anaerolineae bacterium]HOQ97586.1 DUF2721 domain-containing protein [Anaerolineae bacterium]HPL28909.1 DUF2721 domain-containing protein [Anaerolineae bacterium]
MPIEEASRILQLILAPVVMVTASAIIGTALLTHYSGIGDRMRALARERLELLDTGRGDPASGPLAHERLEQIEQQIPNLILRHRQVHNAVLLDYVSLFLFIADMFVIGATVVSGYQPGATVVVVVFLAAIAVLSAAVLMTVIEVRISHLAAEREAMRVMGLHRDIK